jgi:hypothetical protein
VFLVLLFQVDGWTAQPALALARLRKEAVQIVVVRGGEFVLDAPYFAEYVVGNAAFG